MRRQHKTRPLTLETLEVRETPAAFSAAATTLNINLNNATEAISFSTDGTNITIVSNFNATGAGVSGIGTLTAVATSASYTDIVVTDSAAGTSVTFGLSSAAYPQNFDITLNDAASGDIRVTGGTTVVDFDATTTNGTITLAVGASLNVNGTLDLDAGGGARDILLAGAVTVLNTASLTGYAIQADNPANDFIGALDVDSESTVLLRDANALTLAASTIGLESTFAPESRITAGGNITQVGALVSDAPVLHLTSTGGSITLTTPTNNINSSVGLSVTGANTAALFSLTGLILDNLVADTGAITLTTTTGVVVQTFGTSITTNGAFTINANAGAVTLNLLQNNRVGGTVSFLETGGDLGNTAWRNLALNATFPTIPALASAGDIGNFTLVHLHTGVTIGAGVQPTNMNLIAGGDITQSAALNLTGNLNLTITGDYGVNLSTVANVIGGNFSLNAADATQPIAISVTGNLNVGALSLGRGAFNATATGSILQSGSGPLLQSKGAAPATFTSGGTTVDLSQASNQFTGSVSIVGATVTNVFFRNDDRQAKFSQLTFPATVTVLTYNTNSTPVLLPTLNLTTLTVNGLGVTQAAGSTLTVSGVASIGGGAFPITLTNNNDFGSLGLANSGRNDVRINDVNALVMVNSTLGTGRIDITTGGNLTQTGTITQTAGNAPGAITLNSAGSITLTNNNQFRGAVHAIVTGANTLSLQNQNAVALNLGNITTGAGAFTAQTNAGINQFPGTKLTLGGSSTFTSNGTSTLDNKGNTFTGDVAFNGGTFSLTGIGAISVGTSNVTGSLTIRTGGAAAHNLTQTGAITGAPNSVFNTGAGGITLTTATNNFSTVALTTQGNVNITDTNGIVLGGSRLGGGTLTITAGGDINNSAPIVQTTGTGAITFNTPAGNDVLFGAQPNVFRGVVTIPTATDVELRNTIDLTIGATSVITGNFFADVGGGLTLPTDLTQFNDVSIAAVSTTIPSDVTVTGGDFDLFGNVTFTGNRALTLTAGDVFLDGDIQVGGTLTFNMPTNGLIQHAGGTWTQGANDLTINGTNASLLLGSGTRPERFVMGTATLALPGNGFVEISPGSTFQAGVNDAIAEVVTISSGTGDVTFYAGSAFHVGLGATNDQLVLDGFGTHAIENANVLLRTSGLAGPTPTPVLTSQTLLVNGRFTGTVDGNDVPTDVFTGSDIVTPSYTLTQLFLESGGTVSGSGTATGFLPDGDGYKVTTTLGAGGTLATLVDAAGLLYAVTRNTGASVQTLTVSATGGGDGVLPVGGLMTHNTGATTISAATSDLTGVLTTQGNLLALTARDLGVNAPLVLNAGGATTASNAVTARIVNDVQATFAGVLTNFSAVSAGLGTASLTAHRFGTLKTTGSLALTNPGNFALRLTSTNAGVGVGLTSATIAGIISGTWDIGGTVGTIKTGNVNNWNLGVAAAANVVSGGLLGNITKLDMGSVSGLKITSTGHLATVNALTLVSANNILAKSIGVFATLGSKTLGLAGNLTGLNLTLTGNAGGTKSLALGALTSAADISSVSVLIENGNVGPVAAKMSMNSVSFNALAGPLGFYAGFKSAKIVSLTLFGTALTSVATVQNLPAGLLGDISGLTATMTGNVAGVGIGSVTAAGGIASTTLNSRGGNITTVKAARTISSTSVNVTDPAFGQLGTYHAASFSGANALARTIGVVNAAGAKAVAPASQLIIGTYDAGIIHAYDDTGTVASLGKLLATGAISNSTIIAERGLTTFTVGRTLNNTLVTVDDAVPGNGVVGRINAFTAGAITNTVLTANTLGLTKVTGFLTPELTPTSKTFGDIGSSTLNIHGVTPTKPIGIAGLTVERDLAGSTVNVPFGITTLTVGDEITSTTLNAMNSLNPLAGGLSKLTAGSLASATFRVGTGGTWKVVGSVPFFNVGDIGFATITLFGTPTGKALTMLSAVGSVVGTLVDVPGNVGTITIGGQVRTLSAIIFATGYGAGARLEAITVGNWGGLTDSLAPRFVSNAVGSINVLGSPTLGVSGSVRNSFFDIFSNTANIGLGSFNATGNVTNSTFRISDGDVTSFKVQRFENSDLLVGFRPANNVDLTATTAAANWAATNRKLGTFTTTAPFDPLDEANSASFRNSNVVAALLGTITLSGVDTDDPTTTAYGIGFRTSAGGPAAGTLKINGAAAVVAPGFADDNFNYLGLSG